jgi:tetratricopeptide (TPR) repeat protein
LPHINSAFIVISGAVFLLSVFTAACAVRGAYYLDRVADAMAVQKFVALPEGTLSTSKSLPFSSDFGIELLRLTMPTGNFAVAPSFGSYINGSVLPVFSAVELRKLHPDSLNIAALWASSYASSGLTGDHTVWFERSLNLQKKALEINPDRPAAVFQAADSLRELGRTPEAISMLKDFADNHPTLPEARFYHALMVDISGDVRGAFLIEQQLKKDFPDYGWKEELKGWFVNIEARAQKLPASK